jgi:hypothetical protein
MNDTGLTQQEIADFKKNGFVVLKNFYTVSEIVAIQHAIYEIVGHVMKKNGVADRRQKFSPESFDSGYQELIKINRLWGGEVYDAVKQIPAFLRLVTHPLHEKIFLAFRPGSCPGVAAGGYGIRIDNPFEDEYRALWHQEYPAQLRSIDGLVFWSPLVPVTVEMGPVIFCPGSQAEGALPVRIANESEKGRKGAYALELHDEENIISKYAKVSPLTNPRDLVVIDFLVLHASGRNSGLRPRWSMQFRFFNFADPVGSSYAWRGSYAAGVDFRTVHPELFIS